MRIDEDVTSPVMFIEPSHGDTTKLRESIAPDCKFAVTDLAVSMNVLVEKIRVDPAPIVIELLAVKIVPKLKLMVELS